MEGAPLSAVNRGLGAELAFQIGDGFVTGRQALRDEGEGCGRNQSDVRV